MSTRPPTRHPLVLLLAVVIPAAGLALLVASPELDQRWQHQPTHFWLVLIAAGLNVGIAYATGTAAIRRNDARLLLVSAAFLAAAGFLALHALATPGVLLDGPNAGFVLATPIGLVVAAVLAAASSLELRGARADAIIRHAGLLRVVLVLVLVAWGVASLAAVPPLDDADVPERVSGPLVSLAVVGVVLYGVAVVRYLQLYGRRRDPLLLALAVAAVLLGEALVAVALARNWHLSWWEWHVLMLVAFALVAWRAHRQWHEEAFSGLYLDETRQSTREVTVLFADVAGFTAFAETHPPAEVTAMLNAYFQVAIPAVVDRHGGTVDRLMGDGLMVVFNRLGDHPDHAEQGALAALAIQEATAAVAEGHPGWPRFRIGVNTGEAAIVVLGAAGGRTQTVIGDAVNLASRLEALAPIGGIAIGPQTAEHLVGALTEPLGLVSVKGRAEPVEASSLLALAPRSATAGTGDSA
jgi:class 3 adenylate cyclase